MSGAQAEAGVVSEMERSTFRRAVGLDLHDLGLFPHPPRGPRQRHPTLLQRIHRETLLCYGFS